MSESSIEMEIRLSGEYSRIPEPYQKRAAELVALYQSGKYGEVIEAAKELLEDYDDHETGCVREILGRALVDENQFEETDELIEELLKQEDTHIKGLLVQGYRDYQWGDYEEALEELAEIRTGTEDELSAKLIQIDIQIEYGNHEEARRLLQDCLGIASNLQNLNDQAQLLVTILIYDTRYGQVKYLEEDADNIIDFIQTQDRSETLFRILSFALGQYSSLVNRLAWPRDFFLKLIKRLEETNWFQKDDAFIRSAYRSVESFEMLEDERFPEVFTAYAAMLSDKAEEIPPKLVYGGLKELEQDPDLLNRMKDCYPNFYASVAKPLEEAAADRMHLQEQAISAVMNEEGKLSREEARQHLDFMCMHINSHNASFAEDLDYYYFDYPEEYQDEIHDILMCYFTGNFDTAADRCKALLKRYSDPENGMIRKICSISLANTGKAKDALKQAEKDYKEFEEADDFGMVYAHALLKSRNYRKAEKMLRGIQYPSEDPMLYCEDYLEALEKQDHLEQGISILERAYADCEFEEDEPDRSEAAFYFVYHLMRMLVHIKTDSADLLNDDLDGLVNALYHRRPEGYTEYKTAEYVTKVCSAALETSETAAFFRKLIETLERMRTFSTQKAVITSGYSAIESYYAGEDERCNPFLYDFVLTIKEGTEGTDEFYEYYWMAAEAVREHPEDIDYLLNTYPAFSEDAESWLEKLRQDPEKEKQTAERTIARHVPASTEEIRKHLKKSYEQFKAMPSDKQIKKR